MDGYFKVHRKILDSQVFSHQTALKIWIWCLAKVSYKERFISLKIGKGETTVKILPGQFIFGRFKAEDELGIDGSTIYKWMQKFSSPEYDMINIESNNQYSIITICNWEEYQNNDEEKEQPSNNQVTAEEQPSNNSVTQTIKNKKDNKEKESIDYELIKNKFNESCTNLNKIDIISDARKKFIRARINEFGIDKIFEAFNIVAHSDFLNGRNGNSWKANFDWIIKPTNFIKIIEGNYANPKTRLS